MEDLYKKRWQRGTNNTLRFYKAKLPWKAKQFNRELFLPSYFEPLIGNKKDVKIAELGSGMFCTIGSLYKSARVTVYPSDALAKQFNQILKEGGVTPLIPVVYEDMENLSHPDNFFDIVHCANALDHTQNPIKALQEMYRILKPGGYIYLRHFPNVGERENYAGLHMWNLCIDGDKGFTIWNKDVKYFLCDYFTNIKSVMKKELDYETENMVVCIIQKQ